MRHTTTSPLRLFLIVGLVTVSASGLAVAQETVQVELNVDIALATRPQTGANAVATAIAGGGCSSQPLTHDAGIWSVRFATRVTPAAGMERLPGLATFKRDGKLYVPSFRATSTQVRLSHAGKTFQGDVTMRSTGELRVTFAGLSLAEAADVLAVSEAADRITQTFTAAGGLSLTIFEITPVEATPAERLNDFYFDEILSRPGNMVEELTRRAQLTDAQKTAEKPAYTVVATSHAVTLSPAATQASLAVAKTNIQKLIGTPKGPDGEILLVDEPCLQFSLAPTLSGNNAMATAANFRARYDFLDPKNTKFLKLRAEGQGATEGAYYDRIEADAFFGLNKTVATTVLGLGGSGSYAFSREDSVKKDQWTVVAKGQATLPNMAGILGALPGAGTSPVVSLELGAVGRDDGVATSREFLTRTNFLFTARFTTRLSLDLQGSAGWSSHPFFETSKSFRYGKFEARFNLNKDWDYIVRYECGRKPPQYQNFCGTQSGFAMVAGR